MARIFIIEDRPEIVMILEELLTNEGHEVFKAYDGLPCLEKLKGGFIPDLIIIDLNMPGMDGREVIKAMCSDGSLKNIPVMIMTGAVYNMREYPPEGSYQAILQKPFTLDEVVKKVEQLTSGHNH